MSSVGDKKRLRDKINTLSSTEHSEILKIINNSHNNQSSYTKNTNGVFFDLKNLDLNIIEEIDKFVTFCIENQEVLDEYDKKYNECKTQNTFEKVYQQHNVQQHNLVNIDDDNHNLERAIKEIKKNKKTEQFVNIIQTHTDKLFKKNTSTKFANAKKKYAKRVLQDKKVESEQQSNLYKESYIVF